MTTVFDARRIDQHGWRQGAVLGPLLRRVVRERAPAHLAIREDDWLIVTSHDCDIVNGRLEKEPLVEIVRAEVVTRALPNREQSWGRNPRALQLQIDSGGDAVVLGIQVHDRCMVGREILLEEPPERLLGDKERRLLAEWLAKRYIRAAFPTAFDGRWHSELRDWTKLLEGHSRWIQGVYLRLSTLRELGRHVPYKVHFIIAVPATARKDPGWATKRDEIDRAVEAFWSRFKPGIEFVGVEVLGTDEVTLADIEPYQRFDADWVSFADDSPAMPPTLDMRR